MEAAKEESVIHIWKRDRMNRGGRGTLLFGLIFLALIVAAVTLSSDDSDADIIDSGTCGGASYTLDDEGRLIFTNGHITSKPWVSGGFAEEITYIEFSSTTYLDVNIIENCPNVDTVKLPIDRSWGHLSGGGTQSYWSSNTISTFIFYGENGAPYWNGTGIGGYAVVDTPWQLSTSNRKVLIFEEGVVSIGHYMFHDTSNVYEMVLPSTLESVNQNYGNLSPSILTVKSSAALIFFSNPDVLTIDIGINCTKDTSYLREIHFLGTNGYDYGDQFYATSWYKSRGNIETITLADTIESIGSGMFRGQTSLDVIEIPSSVQRIGSYAFASTGLESMTIPSSVSSVSDHAFSSCSSLSSVTINSSNIQLGDYVFADCCGLSSVSIEGTTVFGNHSFSNCTSLAGLPTGATNMTYGDYCFSDCVQFTNITSDVTGSIIFGDYAFSGCTSIITVTLSSADSVSFGNYCLTDCTSMVSISTNASDITFGNNVCQSNPVLRTVTMNGEAIVGNNAFEGCINLRTFGSANNQSRYGNNAFKGCVMLNASITVNSPYAIGDYAFYNCSLLNTITIGSLVTSIGEYAFYNCNSAVSTVDASSVTSIGEYAFYNCSGITSLVLGNDLEGIGDYAFYCCINITSPLAIDENVAIIGDYAFYNCSRIPSLTIEERNVDTNIGEYSFYGCSSIAGPLVIPDRVFSIGSSAFRNCVRITSISLSEDMTSISSYTFYGCSHIEGTLSINNPIESIGDYAFYGCTSITGTLSIPSSLRTIGNHSFENCTGFSGPLLIPSSIQSIGSNAFSGCTGIDAITFYGGMTSTGAGAFNGCSSVGTITFSAELHNLAVGTFTNCGICYVDCPDNFSLGECTGTTFCYSYQYFMVRFLNDDLSVVSSNTYRYIDDITPPGNPIKAATVEYTYTFNRWSGYSPGIHVIQDTDFIAVYDATINGYTVIWKNYDGSTLETDNNVPYGSNPSYNGSLPVREPDLEYAYVFSGWSPSLSQVIGDIQYVAQYENYTRYSTITWKNYDGSILEIDDNVEFGTMPTYNGLTPLRSASAQFTYTFTTWSPEIQNVTRDAIYVAVYDYTLNEYTVTWKNYDGTTLETDLNVEYGQIPSYDGITPLRDPTVQYTYTFSNWSPTVSETKGNTTYYAVYTSVINKYVVTWKNDDNSLLETDLNVDYGSMPSYDGQTPVKAATAQYVYIFSNWTPVVSEVTGNVTYFAVYNQFSKYSTIVWKNYDGTVLETDTDVEFGVRPTYNGPIPTKDPEGEHAYQFSNWSPSIEPVSGDAIYIAVFNQYARYNTVIWRNYDGAVLETDTDVEFGFTPVYDGEVPTRAATAQYTYTFSNWSPAVSAVTGNTTYTAVFTQSVNRYTVTWMNWDGVVLENDTNIEYGTVPTYDSSTPVKAATQQYTFTFLGWTPSVSAVTSNVTYTAQFTQTVNRYTVTWKNYDNTILEIDSEIEYGTLPSFDGVNPSKAADAQYTYTFTGWSPTVSVVTSNTSYTAVFSQTVNRYTVTWKNYDGTTLETDENLDYGAIPSYDGEIPSKPSNNQYTYSFSNWSPAVSSVTGNAVYTAVFSQTVNRYTITWTNEDGTVLETDMNVEYGAMPMYDGVVPTKAATAQYTYSFSNWSPTVTTVTGNASYRAVFTPTLNNYSVTWLNWDGAVLEYDSAVPYGSLPTYDGATPARSATAQYTYTFSNWTPTVSAVIGNTVYTAAFSSSVNTYTVTFTVNDNISGSVSRSMVSEVPYGSKLSISGSSATIYGTTVNAIPTASNAHYTYAFTGWSQDDQFAVTGDCTIRASFSQTVNRYTVTWNNYDGSTLETDLNVPYGSMPSYDGLVPTKPATAQYTYTFTNWSPAIDTVSQNVTYTASFGQAVNRYTIVWKNYDGTTLETDNNVEFGMIPTYDGANPARESNEQYTFTFSNWSPSVMSVTDNATYIAVFSQTVNRYTVTWKNYDGSTLLTEMDVEYGVVPTYTGEVPLREANVQYTYSFSNWSPSVAAVHGNTTYTAVYTSTVNTYSITWKNYDGTTIEVDSSVAYGDIPTYDGSVPVKAGTPQYSYSFSGWNPTVSTVTGNAVYTAIFDQTVNEYTVTITVNNGDYGSVSTASVANVPYGSKISISGNVAIVDGTQVHLTTTQNSAQYTYTFISWSLPDQYEVVGDTTLKATISRTVNTYTVTWKNHDGSTLEVDNNVEYGSMPAYDGEIPSRDSNVQYSYSFSGWSPAISAVNGNVTYTAVFNSVTNKYAVTWKNYDGTVLEVDQLVEYGLMPSYDGAAPSRANTSQYSYTFSGWNPTVCTVSGNTEYIVIYEATVNEYTVTITVNNGDYGSVSTASVANVPYGSKISISGNVAIVDGTQVHLTTTQNSAQYTYTFISWSLPDQYEVVGDTTLKATISRTVNTYTVTWKNHDGSTLEVDNNVEYGSMPAYDGSTPVKFANAQFSYPFSNWSPTVSAVNGDVTYTAVFSTVVNTYTVTWTNYDGSTLRMDTDLPYGTTLEYQGSIPGRVGDAQYTYEFAGWSPAVVSVTGNATYVAMFTSTVNTYTVTVTLNDASYGSITHQSVSVPYGSKVSISDNVAVLNGTNVSAIHTDNTNQYTYRFVSWSLPDQYVITENVTLKATFSRTLNTYTVTWKNYDGTTIEMDTVVPYGTMPTFDSGTPVRNMTERYTYSFSNWTPTVSQVTEDVVYTARMTESPRMYTVSFNVDGTSYFSSEYRYDELIVLPSDPAKESTIAYDYRFSGWSGYTSGMTVVSDCLFDAQFTAEQIVYRITFLDSDGNKIVRTYVYGDRGVDEPDAYANAPKGCVASWNSYSLQYDSSQTVGLSYISYLNYENTLTSAAAVYSSNGSVRLATAASGAVSVTGVNDYITQWYAHLAGERYIEIPDVNLDGKSVTAISNVSDASVTDIRFGQNIQNVSQNAFGTCTSLRSITVTDSTHFTTENGALLTNSGKTLVAVPYSVGETFTIPSSVTTVQSGAISGNVKKLIIDTRNDSITFEENANVTGRDIDLEAADGSNVISLSSMKLGASNTETSLDVESRDYFGERSGKLIIAVVVIMIVMVLVQIVSAFLSKTIGNKNTWLFLAPIVVSSLTMFIYTMYETISLHTDIYFIVATVLWLIASFIEFGACFYAFLCANRSQGTVTVRRNGRILTIAGAAISLVTALSMMILAYSGSIHVAVDLPFYLVLISVSTALTAFLGIIASRKIFADVKMEQGKFN